MKDADYLNEIIKKKEYNSKCVIIKNKKYCYYCGKEMQHNTVMGSYHNHIPDDDYDFCDCNMALKQIEIEYTISNLQSALSSLEYEGEKATRKTFRKMEYDNELEELKEKYKDVMEK